MEWPFWLLNAWAKSTVSGSESPPLLPLFVVSIWKWISDEVAIGDRSLDGLTPPLGEDELDSSLLLDRRAKHGRKLFVSITIASIGPRKIIPQHTVSLHLKNARDYVKKKKSFLFQR